MPSSLMIVTILFRRTVAVLVVGSLLGLAGHFVEAKKADLPKPGSAQAPDNLNVNRIISQLTSGETELLAEFGRYGYRLDFEIQSLKNGKVVGEYHRVSQITVSEGGKQEERILTFPRPLGEVIPVTREDLDNLGGPYQFPLQSANANQYRFAYVGKEHISNSEVYVFDVKPVAVSSKIRLFRGRIWVDAGNLRIVKTLGKFEQKGNQKFPVIEMSRAAIDSRFLFPATCSGDDELVFANGQSQHLRIRISYTDYVRLR